MLLLWPPTKANRHLPLFSPPGKIEAELVYCMKLLVMSTGPILQDYMWLWLNVNILNWEKL